MNNQAICSNCGTPLPGDAPEGLCPGCLIKAGSPTGSENRGHNPGEARNQQQELTVEDITAEFPQLEILGVLGRGGMGVVFKARQPHLDRFIALKVLPPPAAPGLDFADRFTREARALARLNHPSIVIIYDFGQTASGLFYFMMELVDGPDLRHVMRSGELSPSQALAIVPQVCDALQYAHDQGVVHRDIKPENILLTRDGHVKIADFGLAKLLRHDAKIPKLTGSRNVMGTPRYMAPEQQQDPQHVDHRADIYSLGVVFYEMLTGELPMGHFEPPSHKVHVDVRLDQVVLKALAREPEQRYQHASEIRTDVDVIGRCEERQGKAPATAAAVPVGSAAPHPKHRSTWWLPVGCLVAVVIAPLLGLVCLNIVTTLLSVAIPHQKRGLEEARITRQCGKMQRVSLALMSYANAHDGRFPDDLGELFDEALLTHGEDYVCQDSGTWIPGNGNQVREGRCDLLYFGAGGTTQSHGPGDRLVATRPGVLPGHVVVAIYADGAIQTHDP